VRGRHQRCDGEADVIRILQRRRWSRVRVQGPAAAAGIDNDNRMLDQIRHLTERNRLQRDRHVERRLVELRYKAFVDAGVRDRQPEWPDFVDDLFPGGLIPEAGRQDLTIECVRSAISHHGSLLVRGLVSREHVDRLVRDIDNAFDAFDAKATGEHRADLAGWYQPFEHHMITDEDRERKRSRGNILAVESPPTLFDLIETMNDVGVGELARRYFGERPAILARKVTLRRMAHDFGGGWHQDGAFMGSGIRSLNVWLALTHCGDDAPGLDVVGRRFEQLLPTGNGAYAAWGIKPEDAEQAGAGVTVRPIFEAGDALLFDHMCLHRTGTDRGMTNGRYAIEAWFFAPSTYGAMMTQVDDGYSPRDQVPLVF
jgi:Phytanoyl-CoA dioxygenase (PhyH)